MKPATGESNIFASLFMNGYTSDSFIGSELQNINNSLGILFLNYLKVIFKVPWKTGVRTYSL